MNSKERWKLAVIILCMLGLFKGFRPSGRAVIGYAVHHRNFTIDQMIHLVMPATTPSLILSLVILLMITDALSYKPVVIAGAISSVITWVMTIWCYTNVTLARIRQQINAFSVVATELAYSTYMFASIEKNDYKRITSYTHCAILTGSFISASTNQILTSFDLMSLEEMNYLSLGGALASLFVSLLLPRTFKNFVEEKKSDGLTGGVVTNGIFLVDKEKVEKTELDPDTPKGLQYFVPKEKTLCQRIKDAPRTAKESFIYAYKNPIVVKWSSWYMMAFGLFIQVNMYIESLWLEIMTETHQKPLGGAVHALHAIISVVLGLWIGSLSLSWGLWGNLIFATGTLAQAISLLCMAYSHDLYYTYGCFIVFNTGYQVLAIISKALVAEHLREHSQAFIFGINALVAVLFHAILTLVFTSRFGLLLPIREQLVMFALYTFLSAFVLLLLSLRQVTNGRRNLVKVDEQKVQRGTGVTEQSVFF